MPTTGTILFEDADGRHYGRFSGKYLIAADGRCTHARGGTGGKYLYSINGRHLEYRQEGDRFYALHDGTCRWYMREGKGPERWSAREQCGVP